VDATIRKKIGLKFILWFKIAIKSRPTECYFATKLFTGIFLRLTCCAEAKFESVGISWNRLEE